MNKLTWGLSFSQQINLQTREKQIVLSDTAVGSEGVGFSLGYILSALKVTPQMFSKEGDKNG